MTESRFDWLKSLIDLREHPEMDRLCDVIDAYEAGWVSLAHLAEACYDNAKGVAFIEHNLKELTHYLVFGASGEEESLAKGRKYLDKAYSRIFLATSRYPYLPDRWNGLSVAHLPRKYIFWTILPLLWSSHLPNQEQFNFLTYGNGERVFEDFDKVVADSSGMARVSKDEVLPRDNIPIVKAFIGQMLREVDGVNRLPVMGEYILKHSFLLTGKVDHLRLVFAPDGLWLTVVYKDGEWVGPVWWEPDTRYETVSFWFRGKEVWAVRVLAATIWRDAIVVRKRAFTTERVLVNARYKKQRKQKRALILPRTVSEVRWSSPAERDYITRQTHYVCGHYRLLPEGSVASEGAIANAEAYGFPAPPLGVTFVSPHIRGTGELLPERREVVCKGLQVAGAALAHLF